MGFLYPRTIAITRPAAESGVGAQSSYDANTADQETPVASGLPASIPARRATAKGQVGLPAEGKAQEWRVFIPRRAAALGLVKTRDVVTDDLGNRYQVSADYWNSLGYQLVCERLEA